jgi:hypothetical protein
MTIQNTLTNVVLVVVVVATVVVLVAVHGLGTKNAVTTTTAAPLGQMFVVKRNTESTETKFSLDANMVEMCCC